MEGATVLEAVGLEYEWLCQDRDADVSSVSTGGVVGEISVEERLETITGEFLWAE